MPTVSGSLRVTLVLGVGTLDANLAGDADACATHVFECTSDPAATQYKCS